MALLWIEGFEGYGNVTGVNVAEYLTRRYPRYYGSSFYLEDGRTGGYCARGSSTTYNLVTPALTTDDTLTVGFAVKRVSSTSTIISLIKLYRGTALGIDVKWDGSAGEIRVYRSTTLLGMTSGAELGTDTWYYIEVKIKCHDTAGTVEVRVGGAPKLTLSGVDTKNSTDPYYDCVYLYPNQYDYLDDIYICDSTGSVNNDFLGNRKVVGLFPDGDSGTVEWTPSEGQTHSALVDESQVNDDTDYVESDTSGQTDLYDYQDISDVGAIAGIQINMDCRETDASDFNLMMPVKSGGTTSEGPIQEIASINYVPKRRTLEVDPDTGSAWTPAGLNAAQIGVKLG